MVLRENWVDGVDTVTAAELNAIGRDVNAKAEQTYVNDRLAGKAPNDAGTPSSAITAVLPRRGTAAEWAGQNPVLANGEEGWETDTGLHKRGDGITAWNALPYRDTVWYADTAAFPATGAADTVYGARDTGQLFLWAATEYIPARASVTAADITDLAAGRAPLLTGTQAEARGTIGAGTSDLVLGATAGTAKPGDYQPATADITDAGTTGRTVMQAETATEVRAASGAAPGTAETYYVGDYGLVGDWTGGDANAGSGTDDTAALNALIAAVPPGSTLLFDGTKTYRLDPLTTVTKTLTFDFNGASVVTKTMDGVDFTVGTPFIYFASNLGLEITVSTASRGAAKVVTTAPADAGTFTNGDYILVYDTEPILKWDTGVVASNTGHGEINSVKSVDAGTGDVTLTAPLSTNVGASAKIRKITAPIVEPTVRNIGRITDTDPGSTYTGGYDTAIGPHLIAFDACINPKAVNVNADNWQLCVVMSNHCLLPVVEAVSARSPLRVDAGHGYLSRMRNCVDGVHLRCIGTEVRHLADYVGGARCGSMRCTAYDCSNSPYKTHGLNARDTYSFDDTCVGGDSFGWSLGNDPFGADFGFTIVRPNYYGRQSVISAVSSSAGLHVIHPNIHTDGGIGVQVSQLAKDTVIDVSAGVIENYSSSAGMAVQATDSAANRKPGDITVIGRDAGFAGSRALLQFNIVGKINLRHVPDSLVTVFSGERSSSAVTLRATATLNFGSVAAQSFTDLTITVTGAVAGDSVALGVPVEAVTAGIIYSAWVSAANTVTVRAHNYTAGALDPSSGTFKATIVR